MKTLLKTRKNEIGATAIEYGLIATLIAVAIVGTVGSVGKGLEATFSSVASSLPSAGTAG